MVYRYDHMVKKASRSKYFLPIIAAFAFIIAFSAVSVGAAKPETNNAGAQKVAWNLSGDVMPVPPYGSVDIPGSDTASKLIVNLPNGNNKVAITGVMNGLDPNTTYTVYPSKDYLKYSSANVEGQWVWRVLGTYNHDIYITNQDSNGDFEGIGCYPAGKNMSECGIDFPGTTTESITGHVNGNLISMTTVYNGPYNPGYSVTATGTINNDGSITGTSPWSWSVYEDSVSAASGSTGWPGLLTGQTAFTFTTDEYGSGSWHLNIKKSDLPDGTNKMSIWINDGGTLLISDSFEIVK
jgi:hypothetical protein